MLTDTDKMPFGRYKGTSLQDVPVHYLHWLWHNGVDGDVKDYIERNLNALKMEGKDLIWTK